MKTKKIFKQTGKYFRELSIVVIGVAITVSIGLWINKKNNEKDLKQYLKITKMELEENAKKLDWYGIWMGKSVRYAIYLQSNDYNSLNKDSLDYYCWSTSFIKDYTDGINRGGCGYMNTNSYVDVFTIYAFEMLKISGIVRQINDKELLRSIWESYSQIEYTINFIESIFQEKTEEAKKESQLLAEGKPVVFPMQAIYGTSELSVSIVYICRKTSQQLKETISKLEKLL